MKKIYIITLLAFLFGCKSQRETTIELSRMGNCILVPVTIDGHTFWFIWDTGFSHSCISQKLADSTGIERLDEKFKTRLLQTKQDAYFQWSRKSEWSMGNICFSTKFNIIDIMVNLNGEQILIDGVIGADIINQYYWHFDFLNKYAKLSTKADKPKEKPVLELDFSKSPANNIPFCSLVINDSISTMMIFDTGMEGTAFSFNNKKLCFDITVGLTDTTNSFWSYITNCQKQARIIKEENTEIETGRIIDSFKINGYGPVSSFIKLDVDDFHKKDNEFGSSGYISATFMRRFRAMDYDPFSKRITFYKSDQDKGVYTGDEIEDFFKNN